MKKYLILTIAIFITSVISSQIVNIPDANFKAALLNESGINTNSDSEIQISEATAFTGLIDVSNKNISDLTGIEAFNILDQLDCSSNNLTSINLNNNTNLTILFCGDNQLSSIDISNNTNLTTLFCGYNQLTSLDVSNNISLQILNTGYTQLSSLNVNSNTNLVNLKLGSTQISSIDISNNTLLTDLVVSNTLINSISLINNPNLQVLVLDSNINLNTVNIRNSNNTAIFFFSALGNPNLTCIEVDNVAWSNSNWLNKDAIASYSTNCSVGVNKLEQNNLNVTLFPNPTQKNITISIKNKNDLFKVFLTDNLGNKVMQKIIKNNTLLDISSLAKGIYQLKLESNNFIAFKQVIVMH